MNLRLLPFSFLLFHCFASAQTSKTAANKPSLVSKPAIDTTAIFNWPRLYNNCSISPNGAYIMYTIFNFPRGKNTLVVQSTTDTSWKKQMIDVNAVTFSSDEKQAVCSKADTLFFLSLATGGVKTLTGIRSYRQPRGEKGTWLAYQLKNDAKDVVLLNLISGEEQHFSSVEDYSFSDNGKSLLVKLSEKQNDQATSSLKWVNVETKKTTTIWTAPTGMQLTSYNFDLQGKQLVFMTKASTGTTIWYYRDGMDKAVEKVNEKTEGIAASLAISSNAPFFNKGGKYIFFKLQKPVVTPKPDPNAVQVDVWSYKDVQLQSEQSKTLIPESFTSVIGINANKVVQVEQEGEGIMTSGWQHLQYSINSDYLVVQPRQQDFFWNWNNPRPYYIVSIKDGKRKLLRKDWTREFIYSPTGRFIIFYDAKPNQFFSYEVATGITRNVSKGITEKLNNEFRLQVPGKTYPLPVGIAGWFENDEALMIYDNYDIWKIDPLAKAHPVNITNGYGKKNHVKLKMVYEDNMVQETIYNQSDSLLVVGFNEISKLNGLYKISPKTNGNPKVLTEGQFLLYRNNSQIRNDDAFEEFGGMEPLKAKNVSAWLVRRQSATEAPNYFFTTDLKNYKRITNLQPQKAYNWLTPELITYKQLDGTTCQGILYKPENFDPSKKYPVIFSYYETFSHRLYEFPKPGLARARIDIAWYVSRGYLVFTPDIYYSIASVSGKVVGDHAVNSVVGAAQHLSKLPYVDGKRMGIQGHSFGGGETNYLITHSTVFAAACAAAGGANGISSYLSLTIPKGEVGGDKQATYETGQGKVGATLWERPDLYTKSSSVLRADKVVTPLLIMHNQADGAVDWTGSVQMYLALRRLEKPVWMLQYDDEDHQIIDNKKALDFTIRMNQFFDHYLKGAAPPKWMTMGIPAALKGIERGLELDDSKSGF